jgi:BON domain
MKWRASTKWLLIFIAVLNAWAGAQEVAAECDTPPGGTVRCEKGQAAICLIDHGRVRASCATPPRNVSNLELKKWTLEQVKGSSISPSDVNLPENQQILNSGKWQTRDKEVKVSFKVPPEQREYRFASTDPKLNLAGDITHKLYIDDAFKKYADKPVPPVNVIVTDDGIKLTGEVETVSDKQTATRLTQGFANGMKVSNELKVSQATSTTATPH